MRARAKLLLSVVLVSCSSSVEEGDELDLHPNLILYSPMYSAFDGTHDYALTPYVPSAAASKADDPILASSIEWLVDDTFVKREEFRDLPAAIKLVTKRAGKTPIVVTGKTLSGHAIRADAELTISKATEYEWMAGEARYNNGVTRSRERANLPDGCGLVFNIDVPDTMTTCRNCHNPMNMVSSEPTPTQTAGYSNDQLIKIFTEAEKPAGGTFNSPYLRSAPFPDCLYNQFHTWEMTDDEKRGIVWKLRSITPKVQEEVDAQRRALVTGLVDKL